MILYLKNVTKHYGSLRALHQVSFGVPEGSIFGILGPNGSGKTTLLGTVMNVLKPDSGSYGWFGQKSAAALRKKIGTLLETPNFYPYLSARDNLFLAASIKNCSPSDVERVLKTTGLFERKNALFRTFSLGMKQRLAIASALLGDPQVVVLDEPANGLDPAGIADIRNLIIQMGKQGKTVIMASHLLDEVEKVCTHVAILKKGEILATGAVSEVLSSDDSMEISASLPDILEQIMMAYPKIKSVKRHGDSLQIILKEPASAEEINRYCFQQGITLSLLRKHKKSLEMKFMELTESHQNL